MAGTVHVCSACGAESAKWHGRCPGCSEWNTLVEERARPKRGRSGGAGSARVKRGAGALQPVPLSEVKAPAVARLKTGIGELDRVLGGGIVPGSMVLIGGAPGIGKSTITAAALGNLAASGSGVLCVSGEESAAQVRLRAERLGEDALRVPIVAETDLDAVVATIEAERPDVCVVDSVQTLYSPELGGAPGTVAQVREVASRLMRLAKEQRVAVLLVGHVTKDGALAGPRVLEHLVDCVLQFEGERERSYRVLRALKNRFGSTNEIGVFEMREAGLVEVADASARFVGEAADAPGSVVLCAMEGSRPLLVEVQALVAPTELRPAAGVANGVERNRRRWCSRCWRATPAFRSARATYCVSAAGGVRVEEPGADLAIALALASAAKGVSLGRDGRPLAAFGEVGLTGELRGVAHAERRVAEARNPNSSRWPRETPCRRSGRLERLGNRRARPPDEQTPARHEPHSQAEKGRKSKPFAVNAPGGTLRRR